MQRQISMFCPFSEKKDPFKGRLSNSLGAMHLLANIDGCKRILCTRSAAAPYCSKKMDNIEWPYGTWKLERSWQEMGSNEIHQPRDGWKSQLRKWGRKYYWELLVTDKDWTLSNSLAVLDFSNGIFDGFDSLKNSSYFLFYDLVACMDKFSFPSQFGKVIFEN